MVERPILAAENVTKEFPVPGAFLKQAKLAAVDDVSLAIQESGQIVSIVGESGSGKSTFARLLLGLTQPSKGRVLFQGEDLTRLTGRRRIEYYRQVQPVFQDPYGIYNPFYRIERVLSVVIRNFGLAASPSEAKKLMVEALEAVDLRPHDVMGRYPHQLSGGERQRVMLARIYLIRPQVIVADEPVSMIDVAVRTRFLNILLDFRDHFGISCIFITHNLASAYYLGGHLLVMCQGRVVEEGSLDAIVAEPKHPYTQQLLSSLPSSDPERRWQQSVSIPLADRRLSHEADQCVFVARCPHATAPCSQERTPIYVLDDGRRVACLMYEEHRKVVKQHGSSHSFP